MSTPDYSTMNTTQRMRAIAEAIAEKSRKGGAHRPKITTNGYIAPWAEQSEEYRAAHPHMKPAKGDG
ncbi:hypothetical protein [Pseudonocardia acidicola]|uniref:Uncharacterized protein n=1 Tax=Pseudonocardia acidicola TaxID=2724939 RepID=A0ABX1SIQ5_9PSEU|nr:hypothetical protein [Pseudonocardia acidicola]NMI00728.1 hypothetical protein [Pseudonocardia acidicola]